MDYNEIMIRRRAGHARPGGDPAAEDAAIGHMAGAGVPQWREAYLLFFYSCSRDRGCRQIVARQSQGLHMAV